MHSGMTFYVQKRIRKGIQDKYLGLYAKTAMVNGPPHCPLESATVFGNFGLATGRGAD